jgi:hypothetical protein
LGWPCHVLLGGLVGRVVLFRIDLGFEGSYLSSRSRFSRRNLRVCLRFEQCNLRRFKDLSKHTFMFVNAHVSIKRRMQDIESDHSGEDVNLVLTSYGLNTRVFLELVVTILPHDQL